MTTQAKGATRGYNVGVAPNNSLHQALSLVAAPFASACIALGISPFTITTVSNAIVIASLYVLWKCDFPVLFAGLWVLALVLDFADGIVARRTGTTSANGSFYDHFSDKVKVAALFLAVGLRYGTTELWVVSTLAAYLFLLLSVANESLGYRSYRLDQGLKQASAGASAGKNESTSVGADPPTMARRVKNLIGALVPKNPVLRGIYFSLTMVQGNSMILVVPVAFGETPALAAAGWFAFLCFKSLFFIARAQITINRRLTAARISWK